MLEGARPSSRWRRGAGAAWGAEVGGGAEIAAAAAAFFWARRKAMASLRVVLVGDGGAVVGAWSSGRVAMGSAEGSDWSRELRMRSASVLV